MANVSRTVAIVSNVGGDNESIVCKFCWEEQEIPLITFLGRDKSHGSC